MISFNKMRVQLVAVAMMYVPMVAINAELADVLDHGLQLFNEGQYKAAVKKFETAALLAQQMHSNSLESKLRRIEPDQGWAKRAVEVNGDSENIAVKFLKHDAALFIELVGDTQNRESVASMIANPLLANANGGNIRVVGGQPGILKFDASAQKGKIQFALPSILVTVRGTGVTEQELIDYSEKIPFGEL